MKPARFRHWRNCKQWTIYQLALLLRGWEPVAISGLDIDQREKMSQEIEDWKTYALDCPCRQTNYELGKTSDFYSTKYSSSELLDWASKLEGIEIPNPNHFTNGEGGSGGGVCALSTQVLANSDFFTSAFPAEYGNAL